MRWKIPLCKWHTFWMVACLIYVVLLSYYFILSERDFLWEILPTILATMLPLKSKLSWKFQRFNAIDGSIEMLQNSWISKNFQPPLPIRPTPTLPDKSLLRPWNKNFLTDIYKNLQTLAFKVLRKYSSWASRNGTVQNVFQTPTRCLLENL